MAVTSSTTPTNEAIAGIEIWRGHWIGGQPVPGAGVPFAVESPIDGCSLGEMRGATGPEVDDAVTAARAAFPGWAALGPAGRAAHLHAFADELGRRGEDLSIVETVDNGGLLRVVRERFVPRAEQNFRFFADLSLELEPAPLTAGGTAHHVRYDPAGVCALITPWNAPLMLTTWKMGPALAAGNTIVVKPPDWAPLGGSLLGEIAVAAGLPPGVVNVVQGDGPGAGAALAGHPDIDRLSFTGSVPTGRTVAGAATRLIPVSLELGGKSALVVLGDADVDGAARAVAHQYGNAGQVCLAATRILVQEGLADPLLAAVRKRLGDVVVGDPRDPGTDVGPLINDRQARRVEGFVERALADGAELLAGTGRADGRFMAPTLLGGVRQDQEIVQEEIFGPVLTWQTFADEDEAIALANGTRFGLGGGVFSRSEARAMRVAGALVTGMVWVNTYGPRHLGVPFGGAKQSGLGREGGHWSFDFFSNVKNVMLAEGSFEQEEGTSDG